MKKLEMSAISGFWNFGLILKSEIFSRIINFQDFVPFEEVVSFQVLDFSTYTEIGNPNPPPPKKKSSRLVNLKEFVLLEEGEISEYTKFLILALILKVKSRKTRKFFKTCKFQGMCSI